LGNQLDSDSSQLLILGPWGRLLSIWELELELDFPHL